MMSEELRDRVSKLEAKQDMFEKWFGQVRQDISEIRNDLKTLIDKTARIEERVNHLGNEVRELRSRIWWIIGILLSMWGSTTALLITILLKLTK